MSTLLALKRGVPTLARASSSSSSFNSISFAATASASASTRYLSSRSGSGSGSKSSADPLNDILTSMKGRPDPSSFPPRSPFSQPAPPTKSGTRIAAAPITPLRQRLTNANANANAQRQFGENDAAAQSAAQIFGPSSSNNSRVGRQQKQKQKPIVPDTALYKLYVLARPKSCIMTLVDESYNQRGGVSSGQVGFKNSAEGTYEAGYQCAVKILGILRGEIERRRGDVEVSVELMLNGFGQGRGALLKALSVAEGDGVRDSVVRVTDKTPIRIGGVRLQKRRRL